MSRKPIAFVACLLAMLGCCVGIPILIASTSAAGLFAWLSDNALLGILLLAAAAAAYLYHRDRRRRRAASVRDGVGT